MGTSQRKVTKHLSLPLDVVEDLEEEENQSAVVTRELRDAGYGDSE